MTIHTPFSHPISGSLRVEYNKWSFHTAQVEPKWPAP